MCGIAGVMHPDRRVRGQLAAALETIRHRGPDDSGVLDIPNSDLTLGMTRLAVIDQSGGHQPMRSADSSRTVVFNGEIYNFVELTARLRRQGRTFSTRSDTEALLHLHEELGPRMMGDLRGMFAFAIHDRSNDRLLLARDRFGKKPLYYSVTTDGELFFASELKALRVLLEAAGIPCRIREQSIYDYLSYGAIPQPHTIYNEVSALPAGSYAEWDGATLAITPYWQPEFLPKLDLSYEDAQAEVRERIRDAVSIRLRSDVPLGVFLSGGLDSSIVAYEAMRSSGRDVRTFTVASGGSLDESDVARRTASALGIRNTVLTLTIDPVAGVLGVVSAYDQPFGDPSAIPSMQIARAARQHVTVVLNGDGGDEIFSGYRRYAAAAATDRIDWSSPRLAGTLIRLGDRFIGHRRSRLGFARRIVSGLALSEGGRYISWTTDMLREEDKFAWWRGQACLPSERLALVESAGALNAADALMRRDISINLLSALLVKMDMATMAASLEARSPFLDHELADFAWRLPVHYRVRRGATKRILRDAYANHLTHEVLAAPKKGFEVPLADWLRGPLNQLVRDTLLSGSARVNDFIDPRLSRALVDESVLTDRNWAYILYSLLILELWLQSAESMISPCHL